MWFVKVLEKQYSSRLCCWIYRWEGVAICFLGAKRARDGLCRRGPNFMLGLYNILLLHAKRWIIDKMKEYNGKSWRWSTRTHVDNIYNWLSNVFMNLRFLINNSNIVCLLVTPQAFYDNNNSFSRIVRLNFRDDESILL